MNVPVRYFSFCAALLLTSTSAGAANSTPPAQQGTTVQPTGEARLSQTGRDPKEFPAFVTTLRAQARDAGISAATIEGAFANIHSVDRVIRSDRNQPEQKITLDDYLANVMPQARINQARQLRQQYRDALAKTTATWGVQSNYIVALWALESGFGKIQGKEDIFSALATLAFEGRREAFFTAELMAALRMVDEGHIDVADMKSSWAGAMGQNQFMPSSYLRYGADGDGDGKIDIWNNPQDVFASSARYLAKEGWQRGGRWGVEVILPPGFDGALAGVKPAQGKSVSHWRALGVQLKAAAVWPDAAQQAWIVTPDDARGRSFMVFNNFQTLMRWNRSYYFAIGVGMMADAIDSSGDGAESNSLK